MIFPTFFCVINNCNKPKMATYCDEFSFDDVFEDASYVQVSQAQVNEEDADYEKITAKEFELFEMGLDELEFIRESMTEEDLDRFWKEFPDDRTNNIVEDKEIFNEDEFYFQREIMTI